MFGGGGREGNCVIFSPIFGIFPVEGLPGPVKGRWGSSSAGAKDSDEIPGLLAVLVEFRCKRGQTYFVPAVGADIDMSAFGNSKPLVGPKQTTRLEQHSHS